MRVLFTTYGARPHFFPMVPLAWAGQNAGHEVRVAGAPALVDPLRESGLLGVPVGRDADVSAFLSGGKFRPEPPRPGESPEVALDRFVSGIAPIAFLRCEAMVDETVEFARAWRPDLVVYDPVTFAGPVAAQVLGIPAVCGLYGMVRQFRVEMTSLRGAELRPEYVNQFKRFDVEPLAEPAAWIDPCPPSLRWRGGTAPAADVPRLDMRYIRYNGSGVVPDWLRRRPQRPRILVTWGTTQERKLGAEVLRFAREMLDSLATLDVDVVVTVGASLPEHAAYLDGLPANVHRVGWVPFSVLADTCAVIVHTGGTGIVLTTAAGGTPQLGISAIPEGRFNAEAVAAVGAGMHIAQDEADGARVREAVAALLRGASYDEGARRLRAEIDAQPAPADVMRRLAEIA